MYTRTNTIRLEQVLPYTGLDEHSAKQQIREEFSISPLLNNVIGKIGASIKQKTGYNETFIPTRQVSNEIDLNNVVFNVTTTPTTKRPSYEDVFSELTQFVEFLKEGYKEGIQRKGVITLENKAYVSLDTVERKVLEKTDEKIAGNFGVSHKIDIIKTQEKPNLDKIVVPMHDKYELNGNTAMLYVNAIAFKKYAQEIASNPFTEALSNSIGYGKENIPEQTKEDWVQVGNFMYFVQTIPKDTVSYGGIIKALTNPINKAGKITKTTGDFTRLSVGDESIRQVYSAKERDGNLYLSLDRLETRLKDLKIEYTKKDLAQNIRAYPLV